MVIWGEALYRKEWVRGSVPDIFFYPTLNLVRFGAFLGHPCSFFKIFAWCFLLQCGVNWVSGKIISPLPPPPSYALTLGLYTAMCEIDPSVLKATTELSAKSMLQYTLLCILISLVLAQVIPSSYQVVPITQGRYKQLCRTLSYHKDNKNDELLN